MYMRWDKCPAACCLLQMGVQGVLRRQKALWTVIFFVGSPLLELEGGGEEELWRTATTGSGGALGSSPAAGGGRLYVQWGLLQLVKL